MPSTVAVVQAGSVAFDTAATENKHARIGQPDKQRAAFRKRGNQMSSTRQQRETQKTQAQNMQTVLDAATVIGIAAVELDLAAQHFLQLNDRRQQVLAIDGCGGQTERA